MGNECHICRGIVSIEEPDDILLDGHGDHGVWVHRQCAEGFDLVGEPNGGDEGLEVTCPECGATERI